MKKLLTAAIIAASVASSHANAQDLSVTITNLTHGLAFTPVLVAAHDANGNLFDVGSAASADLQAMAEGGALTGLETTLDGIAATHSNSGAPLMAGESVTVTLNTDSAPGNNLLSVVAMLLPTNDGFIGLDAMAIPAEAGTYTYTLSAYDAGTEANDELITGGGAPGVAGIPADPGAMAGSGATGGVAGDDSNTNVHIHRGAIGDDDLTGGNSDLDSTVHRWLNPVARVTVIIN